MSKSKAGQVRGQYTVEFKLEAERTDREPVGTVESWQTARQTVRDTPCRNGRSDGLADVLQPQTITLDVELRQPDDVREKRARGSATGEKVRIMVALWSPEYRGKVSWALLLGANARSSRYLG